MSESYGTRESNAASLLIFNFGLMFAAAIGALYIGHVFPMLAVYNVAIFVIAFGVNEYILKSRGSLPWISVVVFLFWILSKFYINPVSPALIFVFVAGLGIVAFGYFLSSERLKKQRELNRAFHRAIPWIALPVAVAMARLPGVLVIISCSIAFVFVKKALPSLNELIDLDKWKYRKFQILGLVLFSAVLYLASAFDGGLRGYFLGNTTFLLVRETIFFFVFWVLLCAVVMIVADVIYMAAARFVEDQCKEIGIKALTDAGLVRTPEAVRAYIEATADDQGEKSIGFFAAASCKYLGILPDLLESPIRELAAKNYDMVNMSNNNILVNNFLNIFAFIKAAKKMHDYVDNHGSKDGLHLLAALACIPFPFLSIFFLCYSSSFLGMTCNEADYGRRAVKGQEQTDKSSRFAQTGKM